jgi:Spy/CpxP family protein refolding chaperone
MNRKNLFIGMLALVVIPVGFALAQPAETKGQCVAGQPCGPKEFRGPRGPGGPGEFGPAGMLKMFDRVAEMLPKKLELTEEQKTQFQDIVKTNRAELEEIVKKLEAQRQKFDTDLNAILTPEQKEKFEQIKQRREKMMKQHMMGEGMEEGRGGPGVMMKAIKELNLPEERAAKVNEILADAKAKFKEAPKGDPEARREMMRNMMGKIGEILTPEEMDKLKDAMREQMKERGQMKGMRGEMRGKHGRGMGPKGEGCPQ